MATAYARWILATQSRSIFKMHRFEPPNKPCLSFFCPRTTCLRYPIGSPSLHMLEGALLDSNRVVIGVRCYHNKTQKDSRGRPQGSESRYSNTRSRTSTFEVSRGSNFMVSHSTQSLCKIWMRSVHRRGAPHRTRSSTSFLSVRVP